MQDKAPLSASHAMLRGACYGMQAFACYWAVESSFVTFARWALRRHTAPPQPPLFLGILLLIYLCAGGLLGVAAGCGAAALRPAAPHRALRAASIVAMLLVLAVFTRHFIDWRKGSVLGVLILLTVVSGGAGTWAHRLRMFGSAWVASVLALGAYVSDASGGSAKVSMALFVALALAVVTAAALWNRWADSRPSTSAGRSFAGALAAALVLGGLALALAPAPITAAGPKGAAPAGSPNVILIVMDTVSAEHMSAYGYGRDTTPELRAFAQEATRYTHSFSAGDMTLIGHASMFTGLYPAHHGAHYAPDAPLGRPLAERFQTLAEILSAKGYDTVGVVANDGYVSEQYGLAQGFAYYDQRPARTPQRATPLYTLSGRLLEAISDRWPTRYFMRSERTAEEINSEAETLLAGRASSRRPFFLFLNYLDAHVPYVPPSPYDRLFPGKDSSLNRPRLDQMRWDLFTNGRPMPAPAQAHLVSQYDGAIAYLDAHLGRLFAFLKSRSLFEGSLIIVTSDHGEAFGEHGILNHGGMAVFQSQIFVPLLIKYPGQKTGATVDAAVSGVDLLPTVLETAKIGPAPGLDGRSLLQIQPDSERAVISESYPGGAAVYINPKRFGRTYDAIVSWPFKFVRPSTGPAALYDLAADPDEWRNLYDPESATARMLNLRLSASLHAPAMKGKPPANIDAETYQRLKSLGYIQ